MTRYRAVVAYDGTGYQGFQRQAAGRASVQADIENALQVVTGRPIRVIGGARTDAGVHAAGNVIAFDLDWPHPDDALLQALNVALPARIAIQQIEVVPVIFHPRFDATSRVYRYVVYEARMRHPLYAASSWHRYSSHDLDRMNEAAALILGTYDFATFGNPTQGESTTRLVMRSRWRVEAHDKREGEMARVLVYDVEANGFLHHMVRALVGSLIAVGRGEWTVAHFSEALQARDRGRALKMAPPHGLTLMEVRYQASGFRFQVSDRSLK